MNNHRQVGEPPKQQAGWRAPKTTGRLESPQNNTQVGEPPKQHGSTWHTFLNDFLARPRFSAAFSRILAIYIYDAVPKQCTFTSATHPRLGGGSCHPAPQIHGSTWQHARASQIHGSTCVPACPPDTWQHACCACTTTNVYSSKARALRCGSSTGHAVNADTARVLRSIHHCEWTQHVLTFSNSRSSVDLAFASLALLARSRLIIAGVPGAAFFFVACERGGRQVFSGNEVHIHTHSERARETARETARDIQGNTHTEKR